MEFVAVERVAYQDQNGDNQLDALKLSLKYANKQENMKLSWVFLDSEHAGDFSWEFNEAGEAATYYYILGSYDQRTLDLELKDPEYLLSEGLQISLASSS